MKNWCIAFVVCLLLVGLSGGVQAAEGNYRSDLAVLIGNESLGTVNYQFNDKLAFTSLWENDALRAGIKYHLFDQANLKVGANYDTIDKETVPYGGFDYQTRFGDSSLNLYAAYNYNYQGKDWADYETSIRIQMYERFFIYAGVRGDVGEGAPTYDYNTDKEPELFLRGDLNWNWGKFEFNMRPLIYVTAQWFHDYTIKYPINDRTTLMVNMNSLYDNQMKYRAGVQFKF